MINDNLQGLKQRKKNKIMIDEVIEMQTFKRIELFIAISFCIFLYCNTVSAENVKMNKITNKHVEPYKYSRSFILRFSNIIYCEKNQEIKVPVFQGIYEDINYNDLITYCVNNNLLESDANETGFMIKANIGETRKTFHKFLAFYKLSIFKNIDIEKPAVMSMSSTDWIIKYDFLVNGIPCYMKIELTPRKEDLKKKQNDLKYKSVYDIIPMEDEGESGFLYKIYIGSKSTD